MNKYKTSFRSCQGVSGQEEQNSTFRPLPYSILHRLSPGPALLWALLTRFVPTNFDFAQVARDKLATIMDVSPRTVSRWLQKLREADLIEVDRGHSEDCPNTYRLFFFLGKERIQYRKGDGLIADAPRLDIPERYMTQVGMKAEDEQGEEHNVGPEAVILWTYLLRQTLRNFTWKAARRALGWSRRNETRARQELEALGVLEGHEIKELQEEKTEPGTPREALYMGSDDRSYTAYDVNREQHQQLNRD